jgi:hypothetical protein
MTICIITDIDGTIATKTPSGSGWEEAIKLNPPKPIIPMRTLLQAAASGGMRIIYSTARREVLRPETKAWLEEHYFPTASHLFMRPNDLQLAQDVLKLRYLKQIQHIGWKPVVWFEDDPMTISTLRNAGIHAILC